MEKTTVISLLDAWIRDHREEMVEELMNWVRHPSVSRADLADESQKAPFGMDVRKMLTYALQRGETFGFASEDHDGYCGSVRYLAEGIGAEEEIGFVSHLDVVPEGGGWIFAPYEPVEKNGFIIGRGADDNKSTGVLGLYLMRFLKENGIKLDKTFRLMLGCAEETGMEDFRHYLKSGGKVPGFTIVADAGFPVCYAQKGGWNADVLIPCGKNIACMEAGNVRNAIPDLARIWLTGTDLQTVKTALEGSEGLEITKDGSTISNEVMGTSLTEDCVMITAHGKGGHAAGPEGTNNAIVVLAKALCESSLSGLLDLNGLDFIARTFATPYGDGMGFACEDEVTGKLTSNIGVIHMAKDDEGERYFKALLDIRYPVSAPISEMTEAFRNAAKQEGVKFLKLNVEAPFYLPKDDPKIKVLMDAYKEVTGDDKEPYSMGGGTYSRVIPNAITFGAGIPNAAFQDFLPEGHGSCHGPDEVLCIDSWLKAFRIYVLSVMKLGGALE